MRERRTWFPFFPDPGTNLTSTLPRHVDSRMCRPMENLPLIDATTVITPQNAKEMKLKKSDKVGAVIKSREVMLKK